MLKQVAAGIEPTERYFSELLMALLQQEGIEVANDVRWLSVKNMQASVLLYQHRNQLVNALVSK